MATYIRLTDYKSSDGKEQEFFNPENRYEVTQENFSKIPSSPIAYWVSNKVINILNTNDSLLEIGKPRKGLVTLKDEYFLKRWYEVTQDNSIYNALEFNESNKKIKWFAITKGGENNKWYGNNEFVINWLENGKELKDYIVMKYNGGSYTKEIRSESYYLKENITWSGISGGKPSFRFSKKGFLMSSSGPSAFPNEENIVYILSYLNTNTALHILSIFSQTLSFLSGDIAKLPIIFPKQDSIKQQVEVLTQENIVISKEEWDSRETSWDFTKNELLKHKSDSKIETAFTNYCNYWSEKFVALHKNEEELNRLFIEIYELEEELDEYVEFKDITILKTEKVLEQILIPSSTKEEADEIDKTAEGYLYNRGYNLVFKADEVMKQFISYGVGVMFGRYSLDTDGLLITNMGQDIPTDTSFKIDDDNVIPVLEDEYFNDDIASRFTNFVKVVFGEESLSENIDFIEESLGTSLRKYFVKGFCEDHIKRYKKRPIYWMVSSPKKGFMALFYMHRYQSDVFASIQNGYIREYITKLEAKGEDEQREADDSSNSNAQRSRSSKTVTKITKTIEEIIKFDREVLTTYAQDRMEIDLDDGVKVNYCKFKEILFPITGLCK